MSADSKAAFNNRVRMAQVLLSAGISAMEVRNMHGSVVLNEACRRGIMIDLATCSIDPLALEGIDLPIPPRRVQDPVAAACLENEHRRASERRGRAPHRRFFERPAIAQHARNMRERAI